MDTITGRFSALGYAVSLNKVSILLDELIHVYVGAVTSQQTIKREAYAVQDCWNIKARYPYHSPGKYQYYTNSKLKYRLGCEEEISSWFYFEDVRLTVYDRCLLSVF